MGFWKFVSKILCTYNMSHIDCDVTNQLHAEIVSFQNILLTLGIYFVIWEHFWGGGGGVPLYQMGKKLGFGVLSGKFFPTKSLQCG